MMLSQANAALRPVSRLGGVRFMSAAVSDEVKMLEKLLAEAKERDAGKCAEESAAEAAEVAAAGPKFNIGTFNAISSAGLNTFPTRKYEIVPMADKSDEEIHAILLRSHKLSGDQVPDTTRAVARCGSGTNNIDVAALTERGIPVFNTPGANANAVKELSICGLLLASRGIVEGINHVGTIVKEDGEDFAKCKKRVESDKKMFVGRELTGKTLGVIGLGHIGASVAQTAIALGMNVTGFDPAISLEGAWRLPGDILKRASSLEQLVRESDYISLHVPYIKDATHHLINADMLKAMKPNAAIINFARGELVDSAAMRQLLESGDRTGRYITDFVDESLHDHPKVITMPHLGASTAEAEENAASMAAMEIMDFIETGTIQNSVNFPTAKLDRLPAESRRICIVNRNVPGMLGLITSTLGRANINIMQQINVSRDNIAYNVVDIADSHSPEDLAKLQDDISKLDGVISSRIVSGKDGKPGFFYVNA
ncbi:D-3-phosphoglycerate dehydrogenase [Hondaea fermentalgiana]|uniref:phosphoglycerate dehydrogenase n=1 Tax=Hondaea fermentalgiana TaxID=2315210 RepID=A0A2R5GI88_9STRA|nr:D-3-phosphoglycerate dehydrogenase [Hondaea fermentalgiana]|eukprot:GBG30602.1 D-3-phosphoglycerate dehydrogenase [Hondaea fermentalgiana]